IAAADMYMASLDVDDVTSADVHRRRCLLFFSGSRDPRGLHSFPTRRSSDLEYALGHRRAGALQMLLDERADLMEVAGLRLLELDELGIAALVEGAVGIEYVGDAAGTFHERCNPELEIGRAHV